MIDYVKIKTIAVVGLGNNPDRAAYTVAKYLLEQGYKVVPVHPKEEGVLGQKAFPDIKSIPQEIKVDVVDIFLSPDKILSVVEESIDRGVETIWTQLGVVNLEAAQKAEAAGIRMIMDKCIKIEHSKWKAGK